MRIKFWALACILFSPFYLFAQKEPVDQAMIQKIRQEGLEHSQVPVIAHYLMDVNGPRLTNSAGYKHACYWVAQTLAKWGLQNTMLEPWGEFGKGWNLERSYLALKAPYYQPLIGYPKAWTISTNGPLNADVLMLDNLSDSAIDKAGDAIKGKIVFARTEDTTIASAFTANANRYADSTNFNALPDLFMMPATVVDNILDGVQHAAALRQHLADKGAAALLSNAEGRDGTLFVSGSLYYAKGYHPPLPQMTVSAEEMLRMQRLITSGHEVALEMDIKAQWDSTDTQGYNVIGEIPGTDPQLKDQVVMIGAHLDSWHSGTGATDNGAGCVVMMEVIRILKTLGVQPKRTIRIALWGGEEQGLLGSFGYVKSHYGNPADMRLKPEQKKVSAYYNLDYGSGRIRGIYLQGNEALRPIFKSWLAPLTDLGVAGVSSNRSGATDHISFDAVGIPAFQFMQDHLEYFTKTHHSNMDTYDHLAMDDLKQSATVIATLVYHTAQRKEMLPRKPLPKPERFAFDLKSPW